MNSEPRCVNCAYWGRYQDEHSCTDRHGPGSRVRPCGCTSFRLGYGYRDHEMGDDDVHVENDEGWGFATGPLFGCVHFARRAIE